MAIFGASASLLALPAVAQTTSLVHGFGTAADGTQPYSKMVQTSDGTIYGTTAKGGVLNAGTLFKITPAGDYQTVYSFGTPGDGDGPLGSLLVGPDGNIYGTTVLGGTHGAGTVFKYTPAGVESVLYSFGVPGDARSPAAGLTYDPVDGNFYGATYMGGLIGDGAIFKITPAGVETVIKSLSNSLGGPLATLCFNPADGMLYGAASYFNNTLVGAIFKISTSGTIALVKSFNGNTGYAPSFSGPVLAPDGNMYGTLGGGGQNTGGTIYKISPAGVFSKIYDFEGSVGFVPDASLTVGQDGALYGTCKNSPTGFGCIYKLVPGSSTATALYQFTGTGDGSQPSALMQAANGLLYGGARSGGAQGFGSVFNCTTTGNFFTIKDLNTGFHDGFEPVGRLLLGQDGNWYGTTYSGGLSNAGTIYEITSAGEYKVLYSFKDSALEGANPVGGLVQAADGTFYGAAYFGGTTNFGTVYKFTLSGNPQTVTLSALYVFDVTHGESPTAGVILGSDGNIYGTTRNGGSANVGTAFRLTPAGKITTIHTFNGTNGEFPNAALVQGPDGFLYGTTPYGGANYGVIFKFATNGAGGYTKTISATQGYMPQSDLVFGADGNLYGTASAGCAGGFGGIFKLIPTSGAIATVSSFDGASLKTPQAPLLLAPDNKLYGSDSAGNLFRYNGAGVDLLGTLNPTFGTSVFAGLVNGPDGNLYGVTDQGGANFARGTAFKLDVDIPTISGFTPSSGPVGSTVSITGTNFATATAVTINGAAASFVVVDDTHISATVPAGAGTTGNITVTTPTTTATKGTFTLIPTVLTFVLTAPANATAGAPFNVTVTATDQVGNTNTGYNGTVHFTSDDPMAVLPADTTLVNGVGTFPVTLKTAKLSMIRARDTATSTITGTAAVNVAPDVANHVTITAPATASVGTAFYIYVGVRDQYENPIKGYTGTIHFTSTDSNAYLPADLVLTNGYQRLIAKLKTPGNQTITATDTVNSGFTATTDPIAVN